MPRFWRVFRDHPRWLAAAVAVAAISSRAPTQTFDHLKCYRVKDLRAQANVDYTVTLTSSADQAFIPETCTLESTARQLCVDAMKSDVSPPPPGAPPGAPAQVYLCYAVRCTREENITLNAADQLGGSGLLLVKRHSGKRILCAPASIAPTTTTTTLPPCGSTSAPACDGTCPPEAVCSPTGTVLDVCACVSSTSPCGDTAPVCNGICPGGEECVGFETIFPSNVCACIPTGSTPCGGSDFCGGVCPPGTECNALAKSPLQGGYRFCGCSEPAPCGGCPCGYACVLIPPLGCLPPSDPIPFCTGDSPYPVCGGSCAGGECRALRFLGAFEGCVCVRPEFCDVACGAGSCPTGMVCELDSHCNCSCAAP